MSESNQKLAIRILRWICPQHLAEEIEGDLIERYDKDVKSRGALRATIRLYWSVFRFLRPGILMRHLPSGTDRIFLLRTHIKVAYRHLGRSKVLTLINVLGLTVATTVFFLITAYVNSELTFDHFHTNKENIYRIGLNRFVNNELVESSATTFPGIRYLLRQHCPEVQAYTGFYKTPANTGFLFRHKGRIYNEPGGWLNPDSSFFRVFPSLLMRGNAVTVLRNSNSLVISEALALKLFGKIDVIGETLDQMDDHTDGSGFVVTGVLKNIPENAHFHSAIIQHIDGTWPESNSELWGEGRMSTYITLGDHGDPVQLENKLNSLLATLREDRPELSGMRVSVMPMLDIHLSSNFTNELEPNGSKALVLLLALVGVVIVATAWINYINLETSRFVMRIRSVGVRRIVGAGTSDLAVQFMVEYFCLTLVALMLSVLLAPVMISEIPGLAGIPLWDPALLVSETWLVAIGFFVSGSVLVGAWPALVAVKFNPVAALKGKLGTQASRLPVRDGLIVFQFVASLVLLGFVFAVARQVEFMNSSNKGVELETVIALRNATAYSGQETSEKFSEFSRLTQKLRQHAGIKSVATSSAIPGTEVGFTYVNMIKRNTGEPYDPTPYKTVFVNEDFIATYGLHLLAGENFSKPRDYGGAEPWATENWTNIILNERAVRLLGFASPEDAVNKEVYYKPFDDELKCRIIGVLKDYHHEAIKREIYPSIFFHNYSSFQQVYFSVRMNASTKPSEVLAFIGDSWKEIFPDHPFEYFFLDDFYNQQFKEERRFMSIFSTFAVVAVFIACLGILGMALNESNSRLKELSIRKVLGATISSIVLLLSRRNLSTLMISLVIATPLVYITIEKWLSVYPVRIGFSVLFIGLPLLIILILVAVVSGFQTIRSANSSPLDHLKGE